MVFILASAMALNAICCTGMALMEITATRPPKEEIADGKISASKRQRRAGQPEVFATALTADGSTQNPGIAQDKALADVENSHELEETDNSSKIVMRKQAEASIEDPSLSMEVTAAGNAAAGRPLAFVAGEVQPSAAGHISSHIGMQHIDSSSVEKTRHKAVQQGVEDTSDVTLPPIDIELPSGYRSIHISQQPADSYGVMKIGDLVLQRRPEESFERPEIGNSSLTGLQEVNTPAPTYISLKADDPNAEHRVGKNALYLMLVCSALLAVFILWRFFLANKIQKMRRFAAGTVGMEQPPAADVLTAPRLRLNLQPPEGPPDDADAGAGGARVFKTTDTVSCRLSLAGPADTAAGAR